jgi:hypothetical protein
MILTPKTRRVLNLEKVSYDAFNPRPRSHWLGIDRQRKESGQIYCT